MRFVRGIRSAAILVALVAFGAPAAFAQHMTVEGSVRDADGNAVQGALVEVDPVTAGKAFRSAKTKKNGSFRVHAVEFGSYKFKATAEDMLIGSVYVKITTREKAVEIDQSFDLGPEQEFPEFRVDPGRTVVVEFTAVPSDHFVGELGIAGDPEADQKLRDAAQFANEGRHAESLAALDALVAAGHDTADVQFLRGRNLYGLGRADDAVGALERCLELEPARPRANELLGAIAHEAGDAARAADYYGRELEIRPGDSALALARAKLLLGAGRADEGIEALRGITENDPTATDAYAQLAMALLDAGREDDARGVLEHLETVASPSVDLWYDLGATFANADRPAQALAAFERALSIDPTHPGSLREAGRSSLGTGDMEGAAERFRRYLEVAPAAPDADMIRGILSALEKS